MQLGSGYWAKLQTPNDCDSERWLIGVAALGEVERALDVWRQSPSPYAAWHLARLASSERTHLEKGQGVSGVWWDDVAKEERIAVTAWLYGGEARLMLEHAITSGASPDTDEVWHWLEDAIAVLHPSDGQPLASPAVEP